MASGSKNARTQRNLAPKERHRRMPFTHKKSHRANKYWDAVRILQDNGTRYLVEWYPDPVTGTRYPPTWEPHNYVTPALESEWKETRTLPSPAKTYPLRRTQVHDLEASGSIPNDSTMSDSPCATDKVGLNSAVRSVQHSAPILPSSSIEPTGSEQGKIQQSETSECLKHEKLDPLGQTVEENRLSSSPPPARPKSAVVEGIFNKPQDQESYLSKPMSKAEKQKREGTKEAKAGIPTAETTDGPGQQQVNLAQPSVDLSGQRELLKQATTSWAGLLTNKDYVNKVASLPSLRCTIPYLLNSTPGLESSNHVHDLGHGTNVLHGYHSPLKYVK